LESGTISTKPNYNVTVHGVVWHGKPSPKETTEWWPTLLTRAVVPNFVVSRKFFYKHIIKTKILPPENAFCPSNLKTWLRRGPNGD